MKKLILDWSYWLGLASAVIALVLRSLNALGFLIPRMAEQGITIWYMSFFKGALLFFLISIGTANYFWAHNQKSQ